MPKKKHHIRLSNEEREQLETIVRKGRSSALRQRHARILLLADTNANDGGRSDSEIASAVQASIPTIERVRRTCVEHGLERALVGKDPEREYLRKLDGKGEAQLIAMSCSAAPEGRARWTLRLLAARLVELEMVDTICHETVRQTLKKRNQTVAKKAVGDGPHEQRRVRRSNGRRARSLCPPGRRSAPVGVFGRTGAKRR